MSRIDMGQYRLNVRDPLVARVVGPGGPFELETMEVNGRPRSVLRGAPRSLSALYDRAAAYRDRVLVTHDGRSLSYGEAFGRAESLKRVLRDDYGIARGDTVALAMGNRPDFLVALIAITAAGGVAALVNSRGAAAEMTHAMRVTGAGLAILDAERADIIAAADADPAIPRIVSGTPNGALRAGVDRAFADAAAPGAMERLEPEAMSPEDGCVIMFTSGTSGHAKAALHRHGSIAHAVALSSVIGAVQDLRYAQEIGEVLTPDRGAATSPVAILPPMFHLSGLMPAFRAIGLGTTIHILGKWNADVAFDMIERTGLSRLGFVPTMLWDMFRSPRATPELLGRIRFLVNGGAPLNPDMVAETRRRMPKCLLINTYGQSENAGWVASISGRTYIDNPASCGWVVPTVDVAIRREDGTEAVVGEPGEIWTRGANVMAGYVGDPEATAAALVDGWLATGDIGLFDANGLLTIVDRKKNMVISGGENIYCAEVERVLSSHPAIVECVSYGVADDRLGERMVADVVTAAGSGLTEEAVKAHCRARLAIYKVPRTIRIGHDRLARTASGKIDRRAVKAAAAAKPA